jgi:uncharacterized membrane protein
MDYINRSFRSIFSVGMYALLVLAGIFLFMNLIPIIIVLGIIAWITFKVVKVFRNLKKEKNSVITSMETNSEEFSNGEVIDVEYKEV